MKGKDGSTFFPAIIIFVLAFLLGFPLINSQVANVTLMTGPGQCPAGDTGTYPGCIAMVRGCTNPGAANFSPNATVDDGSCKSASPVISGCTNPGAANYNPNATAEDGSCSH